MNEKKAVIDSAKILLDLHATDILNSEHVVLSIVPGSGHGDDIWLRTKSIHCVAEVTISGSDRTWSEVRGPKRQKILNKLRYLSAYKHATHRYLFVGNNSIVDALKRRRDSRNVVVLNCAPGAEQRNGNL